MGLLMFSMRKLLIVGTVLAGLTSSITGVANAASPSQVDMKVHAEEQGFCATIIGKATDADGASLPIGEACSAQSAEDAFDQAKQVGLGEAAAKGGATAKSDQEAISALRSSDILMSIYKNSNYSTPAHSYYGAYGTCDTSGYYLSLLSWDIYFSYYDENVSSVKGFGQCTAADLYTSSGAAGSSWWLPLPTMPFPYDNNTDYIRVRKG